MTAYHIKIGLYKTGENHPYKTTVYNRDTIAEVNEFMTVINEANTAMMSHEKTVSCIPEKGKA